MSNSHRSKQYDVIVCGAGHAGIEAALASARMGCQTLLLTGSLDTVGQMSCNPAIGGVGKGHIVREIDALGGEMAINADVTGIQFRLLNASKGPAVQSPRAQCDKKAYQLRIKHTLELQENLEVFQATVSELVFEAQKVIGCRTDHAYLFCGNVVVVTTGTFLRGLMHVGSSTTEGGRMGDHGCASLSGSLVNAGHVLQRFKTGTPPRVLGRSIDFSRLAEQEGDVEPTLFAFHDTRCDGDLFHVEPQGEEGIGWVPGRNQVSCWATHTSERSRQIVRENLHRSAMYSGKIKGSGPRYCPSIEDKFVRFSDKERHLLFLEPEGRHTNEYYINGLSTSLPLPVQMELVRSIPGLERAVLVRPAYAVEYDFSPPTQLFPSLESRLVENLFLAGQINGTSGYEEAAGQGLIAGINAARKVQGASPLVLARHESYIGVMIDDLVTKGTNEPYRMFTSRAEHRLLLNHSSAELRVSRYAREMGLISRERGARIAAKEERIAFWVSWFESARNPSGETWGDLLRRDSASDLPAEIMAETKEVRAEVRYRVFYRGYIAREQRVAARMSQIEGVKIPEDFDFESIIGIKQEAKQRLQMACPRNLGQVIRMEGVTAADVAVLRVVLARRGGADDSPRS